MKKRKILAPLLCATLLITGLAGCSNHGNSEKKPAESSQSEPAISSQPKEEPVRPAQHPLTGLPYQDTALKTARPVAVMINNIKPALPQRGLTEASIIYEMPVEGGVTRMMAVYDDYKKLPVIGSIRSARHDFVELVMGLNALYVHIGWSEFAKTAIADMNVPDINGTVMSNYFYKDKKRAQTRSSEHCWYTNADLVQQGIERIGADMVLQEPQSAFHFAPPEEDAMAAAATVADEVSATFAGGVVATFSYDAATKRYEKGQYGQPHMDETTGSPLMVDNVFLMFTDTGLMADNYHREIVLEQGTGYYISKGKALPVTFEKVSKGNPLRVYGADKTEQKINPGTSYICVLPQEQEGKLSLSATKPE